jgi:hypothetical protein
MIQDTMIDGMALSNQSGSFDEHSDALENRGFVIEGTAEVEIILVLEVSWIPIKFNRIEAPQSFVIHGTTLSLKKALVLSTLMFAPNT